MTTSEGKISSVSNYGWECPKCNRVYAPGVDMCKFCGQERDSTIEEVKDSRRLLNEDTDEYIYPKW